MSAESRRIPFEVDISRVIEVLATQIYQSPLALLRENTQNAFDAVLLRRAVAADFEPRIDVEITATSMTVVDNGIGMTPAELAEHYWRAGSSGKNNPAARAAGVVGTFGIGAMANFGIADALTIETESAVERIRTRSEVSRENLSTSIDCITLENLEPTGSPGTRVMANLAPGTSVSITDAVRYIAQFVEFVVTPVYVNGELMSGKPLREALPSERSAWHELRSGVSLAGIATCDLEVFGMANGEIRVAMERISMLPSEGRTGSAVLLQGTSAVRTLRSGFGLATISVPSLYSFGGLVDLPALQPTAGREALEVSSNELLQRLFAAVDELVSEIAAPFPEILENASFLSWIARGARYALCGGLQLYLYPGPHQRRLDEISMLPGLKYYSGSDDQMIQAYSSEDQPLVVVSRRSPRRDIELGFLSQIGAQQVSDQPTVIEYIDAAALSVEIGAVSFRIARVLAEDYFVEVAIRFARMTHGVPMMIDRSQNPPALLLDPGAPTLAPLKELYSSDFPSFGPFVKDFVRAHVFPKVADLVPSSTR